MELNQIDYRICFDLNELELRLTITHYEVEKPMNGPLLLNSGPQRTLWDGSSAKVVGISNQK